MAFTNDQLAALDRAIASGVTTVTTSDGKSVTYRSMEELLSVRAVVAAEVAGRRRDRVSYIRVRDEGR